MKNLFSDVIESRECFSDIEASLLKGTEEHHAHLSIALSSHFGIDLGDYAKITEMANAWFGRYLDGLASGNIMRDKMLNDSLFEFRRAIDQLCGKNYSAFLKSYGLSCSQLAKYESLNSVDRKLPRFEEAIKKRSGKNAVSMRQDQLLKQPFKDFCTSLVETGRHQDIRTLDDLLNTKGYDHAVTTVGERTIKTWAKEAGIKLKAGRPKKI